MTKITYYSNTVYYNSSDSSSQQQSTYVLSVCLSVNENTEENFDVGS